LDYALIHDAPSCLDQLSVRRKIGAGKQSKRPAHNANAEQREHSGVALVEFDHERSEQIKRRSAPPERAAFSYGSGPGGYAGEVWAR
jgi:hypothetical protein